MHSVKSESTASRTLNTTVDRVWRVIIHTQTWTRWGPSEDNVQFRDRFIRKKDYTLWVTLGVAAGGHQDVLRPTILQRFIDLSKFGGHGDYIISCPLTNATSIA